MMAVNQLKAAIRNSQTPKPSKASKKKPGPRSFKLIERNLPHCKFVEFPQMKGRTVEKIELYTTLEHHSIAIDFQDHTALHLRLQPCFVLNADFVDVSTGSVRAIREWPPIRSTINDSIKQKAQR